MKQRRTEPRFRVQARGHGTGAQLQVMGDVPFLADAVDPGDDPAMPILGDALFFLGEKHAGDIARRDPGSAQRGDEISVDVDAGAFDDPATQSRDGLMAIIEARLGMAIGKALGRGPGDGDGAIGLPGLRRDLGRLGHQIVGKAGEARRVRQEQRVRIGRTGARPEGPGQAELRSIGLDQERGLPGRGLRHRTLRAPTDQHRLTGRMRRIETRGCQNLRAGRHRHAVAQLKRLAHLAPSQSPIRRVRTRPDR